MKKNYLAWSININACNQADPLELKLKFLIRLAILAPSSHNSQPWKFSIEKSSIVVSRENSRRLSISDVNDRQLYISLGCAVENIIRSADYLGLKTDLTYIPENDGLSIKVDVSPAPADWQIEKEGHLALAITSRATNRNPYIGPVPEVFLAKISEFNTEDWEVHTTTDQSKKNKIADAVLGGMNDAMDDPKFRDELSHYVINNLSSKEVGMPAFGLGIPTPPSFFVPTVLKHINVHKFAKAQEEKLLKEQTPVFVIITTRNDNPEAWTKSGQLYQHIALLAEHAGLKTSVMASAIQIGDYYKVLQNELGTTYRPQVFFRLGICEKVTPHSPRLSAEDVLAKY